MPQKIGGGCSLRVYYSYTCNMVKIGGVAADKLASLFHIMQKTHTVSFKKTNHAVKSLGLINLTHLSVSITHFTIGTIIIIIIHFIILLFDILRS